MNLIIAAALFTQRPGYTKAPEMLGTLIQIGTARRLFPSIDLPTFKVYLYIFLLTTQS